MVVTKLLESPRLKSAGVPFVADHPTQSQRGVVLQMPEGATAAVANSSSETEVDQLAYPLPKSSFPRRLTDVYHSCIRYPVRHHGRNRVGRILPLEPTGTALLHERRCLRRIADHEVHP